MVSEGLVTIPESARCWGCGYSLRGLGENRCPECGRGFEPADAESYRHAGTRPWWVDSLARPPVLFVIWVQVAWALGMMVAFSVPGGNFPGDALLLLLGCVLGIWWVVRALLALAVFVSFRAEMRGRWRHVRRWAALPVITCVTAMLLYFQVPLLARFLVSLPSLNAVVRASDLEPKQWKERWVGLVPVSSVERMPDGLRLTVPGAGFMELWGFAYSKTPLPDAYGRYEQLWGDWYVWTEGW